MELNYIFLLISTVIVLHFCAVHASFAYESCLPEAAQPAADAQAIITGLFKVRSNGEKSIDVDRLAALANNGLSQSPAVIFTQPLRDNHVAIDTTASDTKNSICGPVTAEGIQSLEAATWVVNVLNTQSGTVFGQQVADSFVPGVKLGLKMLDTCGSDDLATKHIANSFLNLYSDPVMCTNNQTSINLGLLQPNMPKSVQLTTDLNIPIALYGADNVDLPKTDNKIRISPANDLIAKVMLKATRRFAWDQAAVVYSADDYGMQGKDLLLQQATAHGLCISNIESLDERAKSSHFDDIIKRLQQNLPSSPAVLVFARQELAIKLLKAYSGSEAKAGKSSRQVKLTWIFSDTFARNTQPFEGLTIDTVRGIFVVGSENPSRIPEFDIHWTSLRPPVQIPDSDTMAKWRRHFYQKHIGCRFENERSSEFSDLAICQDQATISMGLPVPNPTLVTIMDSVYAYALTLKEAWNQKCGGLRGMCPMLANIDQTELLRIMKNQNFVHSKEMRSPPSLFGRHVNLKSHVDQASVSELLQDGSGVEYSKIFIYHGSNDTFTMTNPPIFYLMNIVGQTVQTATPPASVCLGDCDQCTPSKDTLPYIYHPGHVTITGVFPIHNPAVNAHSCGPIRAQADNSSNYGSYQLAEAFWYALENVNSDLGPFQKILKGVKLGGLAIDSCLSPPRASYMVTSLMNDEAEFKSVTNGGQIETPLDPRNIVGFIGDAYDNTTVEIANLLRYSGLPQITYGAESSILGDQSKYAHILMTGISDTTRMKLLFQVLEELAYDFVQVVYSTSEYGLAMKKDMALAAPNFGVCIGQSVVIDPTNLPSVSIAAQAVVRKAEDGAKAVVLFAEPAAIKVLLAEISRKSDKLTTSDLVLIAPKFWRKNSEVVHGLENIAFESIVFDVEEPVNQAFSQYLISKKVGKKVESNQWFQEYVQDTFQCSFEASSHNMSICNPNAVLGQIPGFQLDIQANDVINSVYAYAFGLHNVLTDLCNQNYDGICHEYRSLSRKELNSLVYASVRNVKFRDEADKNFGFSESRDGVQSVTVYTYRTRTQGGVPKYFRAGKYPPVNNNMAILHPAMQRHFQSKLSTCQNVSLCQQCLGLLGHANSTLSKKFSVKDSEEKSGVSVTMQPLLTTTSTEPPAMRRKQSHVHYTKPFLHEEGDILLGGLFPIHEKSTNGPFKCGNMSEDGILMLESFLWAIKTINRNSQVLRGIKMGAFALDSCASSGETYVALKQLFSKSGFAANSSSKVNADRILGFVNAPKNEPAITAAHILGAYSVTNVGPDSPTDFLSDSRNLPYTLRASVPSKIQLHGLVALLERLNWTYVSVVYSEGVEGKAQWLLFKSLAAEKGICIALSESLPSDDHVMPVGLSTSQNYMDQLVLKLKAKSADGARAVVLLVSDPKQAHKLLVNVKRFEDEGLLRSNELKWLSSVGWSDSQTAVEDVGLAAVGALTMQYEAQPLDPLYDHLQGLKYTRDTVNPWWNQYWMEKYGCNSEVECTKVPTQSTKLRVPTVAANIINSVWALAVGFSNLQQQLCGAQGGFCKAMRDEINLRQLILQHVRSVAFTRADDPNKMFRFTSDGWADTGLNILNLVRASGNNPNELTYRKVGYYGNNTLQMTIVPVGLENNEQKSLKSIDSQCFNGFICPECVQKQQKNSFTMTTTTEAPTTTTMRPTTATTTTAFHTTLLNPFIAKDQRSIYSEAFYFDAASKDVDQVTLAVVLPIHQAGSQPLECGDIRHDVYQMYEVIRWSIEQINRDARLLPGIHISPLIVDSCSQPSRAVRDISNLLSNQIDFYHKRSKSVIDPDNIVSVISSENSEETLALSRVLNAWNIPILSPGAEVSLENLGNLYPTNTLLRTGVSTAVQARAMVEVLERMNWKSVSLLYSEDLWGANGYQDFEAALRQKDLCLAMAQPIPVSNAAQNCSHVSSILDRAVGRLRSLTDAGVYGVVVWLNADTLQCLWDSVTRSFQTGNLMPGSIIWIVPSNIPNLPSILAGKEMAALGMLQIRHQVSKVENFDRHWRFISPTPTDVTPWRMEYFESIFGCSGPQCSQLTLASKPFVENAYLASAVRSVYSVAYALESIRLRMCGPGSVGFCSRLKQEGRLPALILAALKMAQYPDPIQPSSLAGFNHDGFMSEYAEVLNLRKTGEDFELRTVGSYNESASGAGPASLKMTLAPQGFENGVQAFLLRDRPSDCRDATVSICQACKSKLDKDIMKDAGDKVDHRAEHHGDHVHEHDHTHDHKDAHKHVEHHEPKGHHAEKVVHHPVDRPMPKAELSLGSHRVLQDVLLVPSNKKFLLGAVFPIHRSVDDTGFQCAGINLATGFQKLAAFLFAIQEVNRDPYVLPGIEIGAMIIDSCSSEERALANWFEVFAAGGKGNNGEYNLSPTDIVGVVGMDLEGSTHLGHMLHSMNVPHIATMPTPLSLMEEKFTMGTVPSEQEHVQVYTDISLKMDWTYMSVLYEDSVLYKPTAEYFTKSAESRGICVAKQVPLSPDADLEQVQLAVRQLVLLAGARAVVLFVSDRSMLNFMKALSMERVAEGRFIVLTEFNEDWAYDIEFLSTLGQFRQGLLTIEVQRHNNTKFINFLQQLTLDNHAPIPTPWFHEFWQTQHQCHIVDSSVSLIGNYPVACTGAEQLNATLLQQSPSVLPTVLAVQAAARGLANYVHTACPGRAVNSLSDCGGSIEHHWRREYLHNIKDVNFTYAYAANKPAVWVNFDKDGFMKVEYSVRNLLRQQDGNYQYREVGVWKPDSGLALNTEQVTLLNSHRETEVPDSQCYNDACQQCWNVSVSRAATRPAPAERFDTVWAVIIAALAALGMVVCVICILYFVVTFPVNYGTTVCGYLILFGLLSVYGVSFFYILNPTEWICAVRRGATGICWALVFAPMLVKVLHTWQQRCNAHDESKLLEAGYESTSSPSNLFITALALAAVQAIIAAEWLILVQPGSLTYLSYFGQQKFEIGIWRCAPGADFESGLIVSMSYVLVLMAVTMIFALLTWNSDVHNRESRWIFVACVFSTLIWICWSLIATQSTYRLRDATIAIGLVSNATVILMCLYMRKAYIYQKYRQEAKGGGYMDNQSQSIYHPSSALGSYMMNTGSIYSTGKMVMNNGLHAANPLFVQALPGTQTSRVNCRQTVLDQNAMIYSNAAYDGGSEFNPGAFSNSSTIPRGTATGIMLVDGHRTTMEASHRL